MTRWNGDLWFLLQNLILKDFRIRYRNMSLGIFWSLLNPLVMMAVFTFVFSRIFNQQIHHYPAYLLCGLVPWNFFSGAWISGTNSLVENAALIRRVPVPRELIPISSVLSNCLHLGIQIVLLLILLLVSGIFPSWLWLWMPLIWGLEIVFLCGLSLVCAALNTYLRDTRYLVESAITILFWLVPVFYSFSMIPARFKQIYEFNPVAALVMALRNVLLEGHAPAFSLVYKLTVVSIGMFFVGLYIFRRLRSNLYDYL
ncbi:MAG TPA: ABC transporter permease [Bryobacteraceae bacterium]|jgi:ABC-type polysaccharide/polyol phosphate export permease|nr:ABC transporter permease [Bryobacteraceae bacterium]